MANLTKADLLKRCNARLTEMDSTRRNGSGKISQYKYFKVFRKTA